MSRWRYLFYVRWSLGRVEDRLLPLRELCTLLTDGTIVETCVKEKTVLRTIIQLDGDVTTLVDPSMLPSEALRAGHWERVSSRLVTIAEQLNGVVGAVTWYVGLVLFVFMVVGSLCEYLMTGSEWEDWITDVLVSALGGLVVGVSGYIPGLRRLWGKAALKAIWYLVRRHSRVATISASLTGGRVRSHKQEP